MLYRSEKASLAAISRGCHRKCFTHFPVPYMRHMNLTCAAAELVKAVNRQLHWSSRCVSGRTATAEPREEGAPSPGAAGGRASQQISEVLLDPESTQLRGTWRISGAMSLDWPKDGKSSLQKWEKWRRRVVRAGSDIAAKPAVAPTLLTPG